MGGLGFGGFECSVEFGPSLFHRSRLCKHQTAAIHFDGFTGYECLGFQVGQRLVHSETGLGFGPQGFQEDSKRKNGM